MLKKGISTNDGQIQSAFSQVYHVLGATIMVFFQIPRYHSLHKKMKFCNKNLFSKFDQIRRKLQIWSHLLKKSLMENVLYSDYYFKVSSLKGQKDDYDGDLKLKLNV